MIRMNNVSPSIVPTPPANKTTLFVDDTGAPSFKDDTGAVLSLEGEQGPAGPAGPGLASGGTAGQFLRKTSSTDYATEWDTVNTDDVPEGSGNLYFTAPRASAAAPVQTVNGSTGAVVVTAASINAQPLNTNLTGLSALTPAADQSAYYNGTAWATYTVTSVGRTLLAATTQAAQRGALGLGTAATQNIGTSGANVAMLDGANTWAQPQRIAGRVTLDGPDNNWVTLRSRSVGDDVGGLWRATDAVSIINTVAGFRGIRVADSGGHITPTGDNVQTGGSATNRYSQLFAANATINTSDARLKTEPRQLREAEFKAAAAIARLPAVWRWLSRVHGDENCEPEGREARKHFGPTVQAAIAVMEANGLDPFAYSFICYDEWEALPEQWHEWEAQEAVLDDDGNEIQPAVEAGRELVQEAREAGDRYSFRKEELLCFLTAAMARQIDELDARVTALENK